MKEKRFGDFNLDDIHVCISCGLCHKQVECAGIYHCPNVACTVSGNSGFRSELKSFKEEGSQHTVDVNEWISRVEKTIPKIKDAAIRAATEYSLFKLKTENK